VYADRVLVDQLLENLIGNALKYVGDGVRPDVRVDGHRAQPGWVRVTVTDNGIGLPPGEHESVFEEFHRAHPGDYDGTGLGLAIARRIVHRHGGTIQARDHEDGGAVFEFTLPAAESAPDA
jgi:signal transduction histidine kinase